MNRLFFLQKASFFLGAALILTSCERVLRTRGSLVEENKRVVEEGYRHPSLSTAKSLRDSFEVVSHVENLFSEVGPQSWVTVFILNKRYEATYRVPVTVVDGKLTVTGDEILNINEFTKVVSDYKIYYEGANKVFRGKKLDDLKKSNWDFEQFGVLKKAPINGVEGYFDSYKALYEK